MERETRVSLALDSQSQENRKGTRRQDEAGTLGCGTENEHTIYLVIQSSWNIVVILCFVHSRFSYMLNLKIVNRLVNRLKE